MVKSRRTVNVCRDGMTALEEPRFLLEAEGKLYLTVAVLEYDPKHPKITKAQAATIRELHEHLERGEHLVGGEKSRAVHFPSDRMTDDVIGANTVGPGPGLRPRGRPKG